MNPSRESQVPCIVPPGVQGGEGRGGRGLGGRGHLIALCLPRPKALLVGHPSGSRRHNPSLPRAHHPRSCSLCEPRKHPASYACSCLLLLLLLCSLSSYLGPSSCFCLLYSRNSYSFIYFCSYLTKCESCLTNVASPAVIYPALIVRGNC